MDLDLETLPVLRPLLLLLLLPPSSPWLRLALSLISREATKAASLLPTLEDILNPFFCLFLLRDASFRCLVHINSWTASHHPPSPPIERCFSSLAPGLLPFTAFFFYLFSLSTFCLLLLLLLFLLLHPSHSGLAQCVFR